MFSLQVKYRTFGGKYDFDSFLWGQSTHSGPNFRNDAVISSSSISGGTVLFSISKLWLAEKIKSMTLQRRIVYEKLLSDKPIELEGSYVWANSKLDWSRILFRKTSNSGPM